MLDEGWPARTWADRRSDAWYRLVYWWFCLRHPVRRWGPRCGDRPYWRLVDAGTCIAYRAHGRHDRHDREDGQVWHADGNGYIWTDGQWAWRGPIVDLADVLRDHPDRDTSGDAYAVFTETLPDRLTFPEDPPRG